MLHARLSALACTVAALTLSAPALGGQGKGHGSQSGGTKPQGQGVADAVAAAPASAPAATATTTPGSHGSKGKGHEQGKKNAAAPRAAAPGAPTAAVVSGASDGNGPPDSAAQQVTETAAAPLVAPLGVLVTPSRPAAQPAPGVSRTPSRGRVRAARHRARRRAARRAAAPSRSPAAPVVAAARPAVAAVRVADRRPLARTKAPAARAHHRARPSERPSPIVRSVERILQVVPSWVALALAAAAVLGLLLGLAALLQARRARRLERDRRRLTADVGLLQAALLPSVPGELGRARVSAAYRPAEGLAAGGDFFDLFALPGGRTALILGDMAGHGREIVPFTALVRYSLRAYLEAGLEPRVALRVANDVLEPQLRGHLVTATVAVFDPQDGRLTYACAGHPQPLLCPAAVPTVIASSSPPIGTGHPTGRRQTTVGLAPGSVACFVTDGVADVRVADHRLGPDAVAEHLRALGAGASADEVLDAIVGASDSQPDDMAVCLLAPLPGGVQPDTETIEELEVDDEMLSDGRVARFLAGCLLPAGAAARAEREAAAAVRRRGGAILVVRRGRSGARVRVAALRTPMLPAGRARATTARSAPAAFAAG